MIFQSYTVIIPQGVCQRALVIILILVNVAMGQNAASYRPGWHNHPHIQPNNKGFQPGHINHNRVLEGTQPPVFFWWKIPAGEFVWTWATSGTPIARQLWRYPLYLWTKPTMISAEKYHVVSDKYPSISRWIIAPFQNLRDPCSTIISSWIYLYNLKYISRWLTPCTFRTSKCFGLKCFTASKRMPDTPQQVAWWI